MNKYEYSIKKLTLKAYEREALKARINVAVAIKTLEVIEEKIKELQESRD